MNNPIEDVRMMSLDLDIGEQRNGLVCPKCFGGEHHDKSFGITRTESGLLYNCFRNKCRFHGFLKSSSLGHKHFTNAAKLPKLYEHPTRSPTEKERDWLFEHHHMRGAACLAIRVELETDRFVFPILNIMNHTIGYGTKDYLGVTTGPKWIHYFEQPKQPKLHMRIQPHHKFVVVVEDIMSANKLYALGIPAVAILGTELSSENAVYLMELGFTTLVLALDPDAMGKALKIRNKYKLLFSDIIIEVLEKDVKDTPPNRLMSLLEYGKA